MPTFLASGGFQADQVAIFTESIEHIAIDAGRATRSLRTLRAGRPLGFGDARFPQFFARLLIERPNHFILATKAQAENSPGRNRRRAIPSPQLLCFPDQLRTVFGPFLEQAGFVGNRSPIRPLPLRPIKRAGGAIRRFANVRHDQRSRAHANKHQSQQLAIHDDSPPMRTSDLAWSSPIYSTWFFLQDSGGRDLSNITSFWSSITHKLLDLARCVKRHYTCFV